MPVPKQVKPVDVQTVEALPKETDNIATEAQTYEELRTSELRYRRLFEAARDGILILDAGSLGITDVNPYMTELLGYSRAEFLGKEPWEIGLFADKAASQAAFRAVQANGYLRYEDLPLQSTDGTLREVEFVSNVYDEDNIKVIQCNIRDITDRRRAEKERAQLLEATRDAHEQAAIANGVKDEFLATLSHELRSPLTAILGWSNMLITENLDAQESKHAIDTIVRNARAQRQLIDDLLDISRIITGKLRLNIGPVDLALIIETVVAGVRPAADAKDIYLQTSLDALMSPVSGDPERLQQIFWNILTNAIKFTPKGGRVQVRLEQVASHVEITVNDTGEGIDPELLPYVFDRFRQIDSSSTRLHGGLGLGLSIVRQLVELHGGTVTAESPGIGEGSTLKVILPVGAVHHDSSDAEKTWPKRVEDARTNPPSVNGLRVLVVDDHADSRELVASVLMKRGAEVVSLGSAIEALEEMERQRFDVLVSDIGMPRIDGYTLIEKIRELSADCGGEIPAAALTAYAGVGDRTRALAAGYQVHIPKPVEPADLVRVVASLTGPCAMLVAVGGAEEFRRV